MKIKGEVALVAEGVSVSGLSAVKELLKVKRKLLWKLYEFEWKNLKEEPNILISIK
jgi:hypothetical protein